MQLEQMKERQARQGRGGVPSWGHNRSRWGSYPEALWKTTSPAQGIGSQAQLLSHKGGVRGNRQEFEVVQRTKKALGTQRGQDQKTSEPFRLIEGGSARQRVSPTLLHWKQGGPAFRSNQTRAVCCGQAGATTMTDQATWRKRGPC